jgi:hypothetical protein
MGLVRPEERILVDYKLPTAHVFYAVLEKVLERLLNNQHPALRQTAQQKPQYKMLQSTFELLAPNMGISRSERIFAQQLIDTAELESSDLPKLIRRLQDKVNDDDEQTLVMITPPPSTTRIWEDISKENARQPKEVEDYIDMSLGSYMRLMDAL